MGSAAWTSTAVTGGKMVDQATDPAGALGALYDPDPNLILIAIGQNDVTNGITSTAFRTATETVFDYAANVMNVPTYVIAIPHQPGWTGTIKTTATSFNQILKEEAEERGMRYLPSWESALTAAGLSQAADVPANATQADGYHPNNTGHAQLHTALWNDLWPLLYVPFSG